MLVQGKLTPAKKLTREEENRLVDDWVCKRSEKALIELLRAESRNIAFQAKVAHRRNKNIPEDDFQQVATEAFIKCLDKYEPKLGYRVTTYTGWWMKAALRSYNNADSTIKRSPLSTNWHIKIEMRKELEKHHEYNVPLAEVFLVVANKLNVPRETVEYYYIQTLSLKSLDAPILSDNGQHTLLDKIVEEEGQNQEEIVNQQGIISLVRETLNHLPAREQYVLRKRFGIATKEEEALLQDIGDDLGVSRERARQLESRGMKMMHDALLQRGISFDTLQAMLAP